MRQPLERARDPIRGVGQPCRGGARVQLAGGRKAGAGGRYWGMGFNPFRSRRRSPADYVFVAAGLSLMLLLLLWAAGVL